MSILPTDVDQKSLEIVTSIAICRPPTGDKWHSKTLFLAIFDPRSSIVKSVFDYRLSGVFYALKIVFIKANRVDPDEIHVPRSAAFHLGQNTKVPITGLQYTTC